MPLPPQERCPMRRDQAVALLACFAGSVTSIPLRFALGFQGYRAGGDLSS
jgi:hypothetical protein